ncbi:unnamed protein product, partial [Hapterophycus canaliculatus]
GSRIVYWIRGNYRVKDNQGLSVAMWLSSELRLPLQASGRAGIYGWIRKRSGEAVTFVDPAIGTPPPSGPFASSPRASRLSGRSGGQCGSSERQELPFRMAVEASGLCEMEQALRALNVPLVAIACAEGEISSTLACWCSAVNWVAAVASAAVSGPTTATAAAQGLPMEGSARIVIMDESYHPRQLSLSKKVKDALRGTAALYAVDSSSVYAVNTSGGAANKIMSPEEFRQAQ